MMRYIYKVAAIFICNPAFAACDLSPNDMPVFDGHEVAIPIFDGGENCVADWKRYHRDLNALRDKVVEYDDARLSHDLRIRKLDDQLQKSVAAGKCDNAEYEILYEMIQEQNVLNGDDGPRFSHFYKKQSGIDDGMKVAKNNVVRIGLEGVGFCRGDM